MSTGCLLLMLVMMSVVMTTVTIVSSENGNRGLCDNEQETFDSNIKLTSCV